MGVYLRNNLPKIKDEIYVINITQYKLRRTHWIAWYVNSDNVTSLELNIFQNKFKNLKGTKILLQIFIEYKKMIT